VKFSVESKAKVRGGSRPCSWLPRLKDHVCDRSFPDGNLDVRAASGSSQAGGHSVQSTASNGQPSHNQYVNICC